MGQPQAVYSLEDYLALEQETGERYEFHEGELFAMAGGSYNHSLICSNVAGELRNLVKGRPCTSFNSELKIQIQEQQRYVYPDATVVCSEPKKSTTMSGAITNPTLIVEVVSKESGDYDRGAKFRHYFSLPSVKEYLLIEQDRPQITLFRRHGNAQLFSVVYADGPEDAIELKSIGTSLELSEVYADVTFPPEKENELERLSQFI